MTTDGGPLSAAAATARDEDDDLRSSVTDLAALLQGRGQVGLEDMLRHIAEYAVRAIPGADGAGLTLFENGRPDTIVASADFVREVDDLQSDLGEGPGVMAAAEGRTVVSGSIGSDEAWPRFGPRVAELGVHSVMSLPLLGFVGAVGAMDVYAHGPDVFDDRARELGEWFAIPAAISVQNALALAQARRLAEQLQTALNNRAEIDHAVGVLMSREGCTATEALTQLRRQSQTENQKMQRVAGRMMDEAVRRAQARRHENT